MNNQNTARIAGLVAATVIWIGASSIASGALIFTGSSGTRTAEVDFSLVGTTLTVTLKNTSLADVLVPTDVLMGVDFSTTHALTPVSASLNGSSVFYGSTTHPGEGWQYKFGVSAQGKNSGISATGLGVFGPSGNFYSSGTTLGGLNYGILSAGDNSATGNTGVKGKGPLFKNSLQFSLTAPSGFALSELGQTVVFQYGTSLSEPHFNGNLVVVPEPTTMIAGALLLLPFGASALRILRKNRSA